MSKQQRIDLNGLWDLAPAGRDQEVLPRRWPHRVPVPGLVDLAEGHDFARHRFHFHRCKFNLSELPADTEVFLIIEQSMWTTAVWCNGHAVGRSNDCYLPQRFRLTQHIQRGGNTLVIRVGGIDTLPRDHIAGQDHERVAWIPGLWGDVWLHVCRRLRIEGTQILPDSDLKGCTVRVWMENLTASSLCCDTRLMVHDGQRSSPMAGDEVLGVRLQPRKTGRFETHLTWPRPRIWHPEHPHLHTLRVWTRPTGEDDSQGDGLDTRFGLRTFGVQGNRFLLNGEPYPLRGGNIAFHRMLGDTSRGRLPWDLNWARRVLADIPRAHHMTFFRAHIGPLAHRWLDIADEEGILIQEEWPFWGVTASMPRVRHAFEQWLRSRWNHPSIVMWDPGNECDLRQIERHVIPTMRRLDPTRPWAHVDADEEHPYHWSLTPVWPERAMGHGRSPEEIRDARRPAIVNEFLWFWLDSRGEPTTLTNRALSRWLGHRTTRAQRFAHQAWLARECVEMWRRIGAAAIQPFVYLSADGGCTAHWFRGDLGRLFPKPVLYALREAMAPLGASLDLASRHLLPSERCDVPLHLFNDSQRVRRLHVEFGIADKRRQWIGRPQSFQCRLGPASRTLQRVTLRAPGQLMESRFLVLVHDAVSGESMGVSEKIIQTLNTPTPSAALRKRRIAILDPRAETQTWLTSLGLSVENATPDVLEHCHVVWIGETALRTPQFRRLRHALEGFVHSGGLIILQEPELGAARRRTIAMLPSVNLTVGPRRDIDAGGYDSVVHPTADCPRALLSGLRKEHLAYLNGGIGNMMVSEAVAELDDHAEVWISSGLDLAVKAVSAQRVGRGLVIVNRIQIRGRLLGDATDPWPRYSDPIAQRLALNLLGIRGMQSSYLSV